MSKNKTLAILASIGFIVTLIIIAFTSMGVQYLAPDEECNPVFVTGDWHFIRGQWVAEGRVDTMADTPSGARSVWNTGTFTMETNRYYVDGTIDNVTATADSVNIWIRLYNSLDKGASWYVADSIQIKAKPVATPTAITDSLDGKRGALAYVKTSDSLTTLDTMIMTIEMHGFEGYVLP